MALIRKQIEVEVQIGDTIKAPNTVYRDDLTLYVCHIEGDLLYMSDEKNASKNDCVTSFVEDCYLDNTNKFTDHESRNIFQENMQRIISNYFRVRCLECKEEHFIEMKYIGTDKEQRSLGFEYEHTFRGELKCSHCGEKIKLLTTVYEYPKEFINYVDNNYESCLIINDVTDFANKLFTAINKETAGHMVELENIDEEKEKSFERWVEKQRKKLIIPLDNLSQGINHATENRCSDAWDTLSVIAKLVEAADILLHKKDYDGHGWEEIEICYKRGLEILQQESLNMSKISDRTYTLNEVITFIKAFHLDTQEGNYSKELLDWCNQWIENNVFL